MLNVTHKTFMLNVVMNVVMLNVVAPFKIRYLWGSMFRKLY